MPAASRIIQAFQAGRQEKLQEEQRIQQQEERKLENDLLQQRIRENKLKERLQARDLALQRNQLKQGQPGQIQQKTAAADLGQGQAPEPVDLPAPQAGEGLPGVLQQLIRGNRAQLQGVPNPAQLVETQEELPHAPDVIPPIEELGEPGFTLQAQNQGQVQAQAFKALLDKMKIEALGKQAESQVQMPGGEVVDARAIPAITAQANREAADARLTQGQQFTAGQNALNRASRERGGAILQALRQKQLESLSHGELTPKQISTSLQLSNSLKGHPAYSDMLDIYTGMQGTETGLSQKNGFGDITAINAFQRMVDPGATVREGDVALLQSGTALLDKILSDYPIEKLKSGAKLPDATRAMMLKTARELYARRAKNYNETVGKQYKDLSKAAGISFQYVGRDFEDAGQTGDGGDGGTIRMKGPDGKIYKVPKQNQLKAEEQGMVLEP